MDLSLIQTHLDNFVTTWEGWANVVKGLKDIFALGEEGFDGLSSAFDVFSSESK